MSGGLPDPIGALLADPVDEAMIARLWRGVDRRRRQRRSTVVGRVVVVTLVVISVSAVAAQWMQEWPGSAPSSPPAPVRPTGLSKVGPPSVPRESPPTNIESSASSEPPCPPPTATTFRADALASGWRAFAHAHQYTRAYEAAAEQGGIERLTRTATVDELFELADVARLGGSPASAVAPLERILDEYQDHPDAALAAFTLGRVELDALGHPQEASRAFERALRLPLGSELRSTARRRLCESYARAGDCDAARRCIEAHGAGLAEASLGSLCAGP